MPKPTNNDQFYSDWYDHQEQMAAYMAVETTKREQTEKEIEDLNFQKEKNNKFRCTISTI